MIAGFTYSRATEALIKIPVIGLDLFARLPPAASGGDFCLVETINVPGKGPPQHRHARRKSFRVIEGRYLYRVDGRRFFAEAGDVVSIPEGAAHGFVNVTDKPACQYILIAPALDRAAFFTELGETIRDGFPDRVALNAFGVRWNVEFLGPPLMPHDQPTD
jgi:Cupin domain